MERVEFLLEKCVSNGYTSKMTEKDVGMRIRVERDLRDRFIELCRSNDRPAAQVIRDFMRQYIKDNSVANDTNPTNTDKRQA